MSLSKRCLCFQGLTIVEHRILIVSQESLHRQSPTAIFHVSIRAVASPIFSVPKSHGLRLLLQQHLELYTRIADNIHARLKSWQYMQMTFYLLAKAFSFSQSEFSSLNPLTHPILPFNDVKNANKPSACFDIQRYISMTCTEDSFSTPALMLSIFSNGFVILKHIPRRAKGSSLLILDRPCRYPYSSSAPIRQRQES